MLILFIILIATSGMQAQDCPNPLLDSTAKVIVISVSDGDTFKFAINHDTITVRVLGIDCFETRNGKRLREQAEKAGITVDSALSLGKQAKHIADSLMTGKEVTIVRDFNEKNFDTYNRLLRGVNVNGRDYADIVEKLGLVLTDQATPK